MSQLPTQQVTLDQAMRIGLQNHEAGRLKEAEMVYRQVLQAYPNHPDATHLLGVIAHQSDHNKEAFELISRAVILNPTNAACFSNLGEVHRCLGRIDEALQCYRKSIALDPNFPEAYSNLGNVLVDKKEYAEAIAACKKAIALKPTLAQAYNNLGNAYEGQQDFEGAFKAYHDCLKVDPNFAKAHSNLGIALHQKGRIREAAESYRKAITCDPAFPDAHWNHSLALLLTGNFAQGWEEYEWRWKSKDFPSPIRNFPHPLWHRQDLTGKTIMLHAEQGFGDAIQFARFVPMIARRAGKVIVECQPELRRLFTTLEGVASVHDRGAPLPPFDIQAPFLSIPRAFGTDLTNIPATVPYLSADPAAVAVWKEKFAANNYKFTVGIVWAGRPTHREDARRSLKLIALKPMLEIPGASFISLQKGPATAQIAETGLPVLDISADLKDFADTATVISALDLVLSIDTAVIHLAGALAKPVWSLVTWIPDWRWLENRTDTPWYPTMRLYRQPAQYDWISVLTRITEDLRKHVAERGI